MPKSFRKAIRIGGLRAYVRKRIRGNSIDYEIRCRRDGYNISASGLTVEEAKARFIQKLDDLKNGVKPAARNIPVTFDKFALYYFENFRKRKVADSTYKNDCKRLKIQILPYFGNIRIRDITPEMCQNLIDDLEAAGKGKTAEEVFSLLNCTLKTAIKHNIMQHNPLDIVVHTKHERKHGKALTRDEETHLLEAAAEPFRTWFAIGLYTGLRPNEYATIRISKNMIEARNSKRHGGKEETKRIPITPMLRPYISDVPPPVLTVPQIRKAFNAVFGDAHKLYDLRTTFYTRCQMCGVAPAARDEFMGHSSGELANAYTDLPDDYLIKEGQKLDY